jgi:tetratricopeptide (TPR) repeat protein
MQRHLRLNGSAVLISIGLCLISVPLSAAPLQDTLPEIRLEGLASSVELLPPEPGSGSNQARPALRVTIRLELTNSGSTPAALAAAALQFKCGADATPRQQYASDFRWQVPVGGREEVQLSWSILPFPREEEPLRLEWGTASPESRPAAEPSGSLDLNAELRRLQAISIERTGPDGALAIISSRRELDALALWVLDKPLRELSQAGVARVLFVPAGSDRLKVSGEASMWIAALPRSSPAAGGQQFMPFPRPQYQFRFAALAAAEMLQDGSPFRQNWMAKMYQSRDDAIVEALQAVYRIAPVQQALRDLQSDNPGIRRAALAGAVDRLTEEQASGILAKTLAGTPAQQRELASLLNQLPGRRAIETLQELALSDDEAVAAAALSGLATSQDEAAAKAMAAIWEAGQARPSLRTLAAAAMVLSDDSRWTSMISAWVLEALELTLVGQTSGFSRQQFASAVAFLIQRRHESTLARLQADLSKVSLAEFQDELIRQLVQTGVPGDLAAVSAVITQRLESGSVSQEVRDAAAVIRNPTWTPMLLTDFRRSAEARGRGDASLRVVLACAASSQLEDLIQGWEKLPQTARGELLAHLAQQNHPEWRRLAAGCLNRSSAISFNALQLLASDASEESLQVLLQRARSWVEELGETRDASVEGQNFLQQLLSYIAVFSHPECRRLMNQLSRSSNEWVQEQSENLRQTGRSRSPAWRLLYEYWQLRKAEDEESAAKILEVAIATDPFLPDLWVRRASERMHAGLFDDSMADLRRADELSPEHEEVLSMIALVLVRQGKVDEGLAAAEELVRSAPKDLYALYNGACAFARAAERPDIAADRRTQLITRAIELLRQNNDAGHDDHEHMSTDPDLNVLHDHPDWEVILAKARLNAEQKPKENR